MIEVSLSEKGRACRAIQGISTLGDSDPMYITECYRCTGVIIVLVRKPEVRLLTAQYVVAGYQIPPGSKGWARAVSKDWFKELRLIRKHYVATAIGICGGKIDTPINQKWYEILQGQFVSPMKRLFPEAAVIEMKPALDTNYSTMYMDEEFNIIIEQF
jgi:hypothetical protein